MFSKKYFREYLSLFLILICLGGSVLGLEPENGIDLKLFPEVQEFMGESGLCGGNFLSEFQQSFIVNQQSATVQMSLISTMFKYNGYFTQGLRVQKSEFEFNNSDYIQYLGYDKRLAVWDQNTNRIKVVYFHNGSVKKTRYFDTNGILSDVLHFFLQGMLLKGNREFRKPVISTKDGKQVEARFLLMEQDTGELEKLTPEYSFLANIQKKIANRRVYIYVMEFTGITKLLYPYKYYFVYNKEPPYSIVAYWGGSPQDSEYAYVY